MANTHTGGCGGWFILKLYYDCLYTFTNHNHQTICHSNLNSSRNSKSTWRAIAKSRPSLNRTLSCLIMTITPRTSKATFYWGISKGKNLWTRPTMSTSISSAMKFFPSGSLPISTTYISLYSDHRCQLTGSQAGEGRGVILQVALLHQKHQEGRNQREVSLCSTFIIAATVPSHVSTTLMQIALPWTV